MAPSEPVDTITDVQIKELEDTSPPQWNSSSRRGVEEGRSLSSNPPTSAAQTDLIESGPGNHEDGRRITGSNTHIDASVSRNDFDYIDAVTNLMVRNEEVVAVVACGPTRGIILVSETEVRLQY